MNRLFIKFDLPNPSHVKWRVWLIGHGAASLSLQSLTLITFENG